MRTESRNDAARTLVWAVFVMMMAGPPASAQQLTVTEKYLNSHAHCGHTDARETWFTVNQQSVFNVLDDVSPNTGTHAFRDCEMIFRSIRVDGRLCVQQKKLNFQTNDIKLELYDRYGDEDPQYKPNKTLDSSNGLIYLEWCTTGRFLTVKMVKSGPSPSVRDVDIDLLIYDLQSVHRRVFMDSVPSCGSTFILDQSRVNVTNVDPYRQSDAIYPRCIIHFDYDGREENRNVCLVFESTDVTCSKVNYTLTIHQTVTNPETGMPVKVFQGTRSCGKAEPSRWCSNSTKISLELQRHWMMDSFFPEKDVVFYALVMDHMGDSKSLPSIFTATKEPDTSSVDVIVIGVVCAAVFVLIVLSLLIFILIRRWLGSKFGGERSPGDGTPEQQSMLRVNGDAGNVHNERTHNGKNVYTDGTTATASASEPVHV